MYTHYTKPLSLTLLVLLITCQCLTGCRDDEPITLNEPAETPEDFSEEQRWEPVGDKVIAPQDDNKNLRSDTFSMGDFDPSPHVPNFELADKNTLVMSAEIDPITLEPEQSKMARVKGDVLEFPMAMASDAMAWQPGEIVVSGGGGPSNPFGFAREVISVEQDGDTIIVHTRKAELSDIIQGDLVMTFDPEEFKPVDLSQLDPDWVKENLGEDSLPPSLDRSGWSTSIPTYDVLRVSGFFLKDFFKKAAKDTVSAFEKVGEAIEDGINELINAVSVTLTTNTWHGFDTGTISVTFPIPKTQLSPIKPKRGGNMQTYIEGFVKPSFALNFDPGLQLEMVISPDPNDARIKLNMDSKINVDAGIHTQFEIGIESWDGSKGISLKEKLGRSSLATETAMLALSQAIQGDPAFTPGSEWKKTIWTSAPYVKGFVVGVVPVAVVARFHIEAGCSFAAKGSVDFKADSSVELKTKFSAEQYYLKFTEGPRINGPTTTTAASGSWSVTTGADAQFECFLLPSVEVSLYDALGVVMGPRISPFVAQIEAQGSCPNTFHPQSFTPQTDASLRLFTAISGQASFKVSPPGVPSPAITIGPQIFGQWTQDLWGPQDMSFGLGIGYCTPQCEDGMKNGDETGVDCGGGGCGPCADGQECEANSDCIAEVCLASTGVCNSDTCVNGVQDNGETDVDCGGPCEAKCALGQGCGSIYSWCESGICSANSQICVATFCEDQRQSTDESGIDCGGNCDALCATGAAGTTNSGCASGFSNRTVCVASHCEDRWLSGDETSQDCGGSCKPCADYRPCNVDTDCRSGACGGRGICALNKCIDYIQNGTETGQDCGGDTCVPCFLGVGCQEDSDCQSGFCNGANLCDTPHCDDFIKNRDEVGIDCGGLSCPKCGNGNSCVSDGDCESNICAQGGSCVATLCDDGVQNNGESAKDCGGDNNSCRRCNVGLVCNTSMDCQSGFCSEISLCAESQCSDSVQNGNESFVDCGGDECKKCVNTQGCNTGADCQSGICSATNGCVASLCQDNRLSGDESDIDCGGSCTSCGNGRACQLNSDCMGGYCNGGVCDVSSCSDSIQNGDEAGVDCGGSCAGCATGTACQQPSDCSSGFCSTITNVCVSNSCDDGIVSGFESDVDCGGEFACAPCTTGQACMFDTQCDSGNCACGENSGDCIDFTVGGPNGTCGAAIQVFDQRAANTSTVQNFTVPPGCFSVYVQAWGGGGGSTPAPGGAVTGGAGGFVSGSIAVTPGDSVLASVAHGGYPAGNMSVPWGTHAGGMGDSTGTSGGGATLVSIAGNMIVVPGGGGSSMSTAGTAVEPTTMSTHISNDGANATPGSDEGGGGAGLPGGLPGKAGAYGTLPQGFTAEAGSSPWTPGGSDRQDYLAYCHVLSNDVAVGASDAFGAGSSGAGFGGQGCVIVRCE